MPTSDSPPPLRGGYVLPRAGRRLHQDIQQNVSLPEFGMCVGQDSKSAGATAWLWLPNGGHQATYKALGAYRWNARIQSGEEAVTIAQRLLRKIAEEHGYSVE
jgi:hypothetical protein